MTEAMLLSEEELTERAIDAHMRDLGPVETARFLTRINPPERGADSVQRRRAWLQTLDQSAFVSELLARLDNDPRSSQ